MKVLLLDNRALFLEGLQNLLQSYGIEVVGVAPHEAEALTKTRLLAPDVIMINIPRNSRERLEAIRHLRAEIPSVHIIAFADCHENLTRAVRYGAYSYLLTDIHGDQLLQKLRDIEQEIVIGKDNRKRQ